MNHKNALIIGASRGIGKAVALRLAQDGFDIIATCRSTVDALAPLVEAVEALGHQCETMAFDISDRQATEQLLQQRFPEAAPDVIVYNASIARDGLLAFMPAEDWDAVLHTNLDGFFNVVKPLIFNLLHRKQGRIIAMTSASGQVGQPGQVNYSASKAGLIGAVKSLAKEIGKKGILVNAVAPGFIDTDMTAAIPQAKVMPLIPLNRIGSTDDVAGLVSFLAGPDSSYIHGQVIAVNGGLVI